jgi:putative endonuclease
MARGGFVYIVTNKRYGALYAGVTADLVARITQHREGKRGAFTSRYKLTRLVYFEQHSSIEEAIAREKAIKAWKRQWKIEAIETMNPSRDDLYGTLHLLR